MQTDNWYRDHIRYFVTPALLLSEGRDDIMVSNTDFLDDSTRIEGSNYSPDIEAEQIVKLEILDTRPVLTDRDYRLILDSINALENRAKDKAVILPGRDVWPFFVLMMKRKVWRDRIYHFPWMSRYAMTDPINVHQKMVKAGIDKDELIHRCFLFDTGFAGSIFRGIEKAFKITEWDAINDGYKRPPNGMVSSNSYSGQSCILQKNIYRSQVLRIEEYLPKYLTSGNHRGEQTLNKRNEIIRAARLTYDLWHGITEKEEMPKVLRENKAKYKWCNNCKQYHKLPSKKVSY